MIKKLARRLTAVAVLSLAAAGVQAETLSVAATPVPHAELLDFVKPKLKDPTNILSTSRDLAENPHKLKFRELDAAFLPRALDDADLALINTNYALAAGLQPTRDALLLEGADSPYANIVTARPDNAESPAIAKLMKALRSPETKKFIEEKYKGAIIPAF